MVSFRKVQKSAAEDYIKIYRENILWSYSLKFIKLFRPLMTMNYTELNSMTLFLDCNCNRANHVCFIKILLFLFKNFKLSESNCVKLSLKNIFFR